MDPIGRHCIMTYISNGSISKQFQNKHFNFLKKLGIIVHVSDKAVQKLAIQAYSTCICSITHVQISDLYNFHFTIFFFLPINCVVMLQDLPCWIKYVVKLQLTWAFVETKECSVISGKATIMYASALWIRTSRAGFAEEMVLDSVLSGQEGGTRFCARGILEQSRRPIRLLD